jgi:hypothetical protein
MDVGSVDLRVYRGAGRNQPAAVIRVSLAYRVRSLGGEGRTTGAGRRYAAGCKQSPSVTSQLP